MKSCLVGLHGLGQNGSVLAKILAPLTQQGVALLLPDGPHRHEVRKHNQIRQGHAWYIYTGDQELFLQSLLRSEKDLLDLVRPTLKEHGIEGENCTLLGFSQGGYLAGFVACRQPQLFRNCVIASARLKHEFLTEALASQVLPEVLFLHDKKDPLTRPEPVTDSCRILEEAGARTRIDWHDDGHRLGNGSLEALQIWLAERGLLG
ncbi:MAG: hypothetical protein AAEJ04_07850 [Planctomycetota bacterium]